jgi:lipopolysaccharide/colanic/teichoic acid biosynthesis glycosyltransferase
MYSLFDAAMLTQQPSPKDRKRVNAESIVSASSCASRSRPAVLPSASRSGLERRRLQCYLALLLGDIAMLVSAFVFGGWIYQGSVGVESGLILVQLVIPVFLTGALYNNSYSLRSLEKVSYGAVRALIALAISSAVVIFIAFYTKSSQDFSRIGFTLGVALSAIMIPWLRAQMRGFVTWRCGSRVTYELLIDDEGPAIELPGATRIDARRYGLVPDSNDPVALDRIGGLLRGCDRVIVSCPPERRHAWSRIFKGTAVAGEVIDNTIVELDAIGARQAGGYGLLLVSVGPLGLRSRTLKRTFDVIVAGLGILVLSPVIALVALLIFLEDRGPVLFVQKRMGLSNTFFPMLKFRSMRVAQLDDNGAVSTARGDVRITRIGSFIRRTSLDELPQLFNVLLGDMSIVGPRPHAIGSLAGEKTFWEVDSRYWLRHALKPGLTGLAQVRGLRGATDHESDLQDRLHSDLEYLNGWSIWRDVRIVFATIRVLVHDRAY